MHLHGVFLQQRGSFLFFSSLGFAGFWTSSNDATRRGWAGRNSGFVVEVLLGYEAMDDVEGTDCWLRIPAAESPGGLFGAEGLGVP